MQKKKALFIYNPKSGKGKIKNYVSDIIDTLTKKGFEVLVHPTQCKLDATAATVEKRNSIKLLVCSGGDGTLDEVITGMMHRDKKIPIAYIPAGSTNDFGNSLKIPSNIPKAIKSIFKGKVFPCDIGKMNDDFFVYIAAFGLFTDVSYETDQNLKNVLGHAAYLLEGVKRLSQIKSVPCIVEYDGIKIEDEFIFGMVTNSMSVGGFKKITGKHVELDDGVFEVTLVKMPKNPLELSAILTALMNRDIDTDLMYCFKTGEVKFTMQEEVPWTLDGEFGGNMKEVTIQNCNKAIEIVVPKEN